MLPASAPPALHSYAPTPALAAVRALRWISKRPVVLRINRVGQYAAVLTRGGIVEDSPVTSPIIVERFAFGWQPVEILYNDCRVKALANRAGVTAVRRLMPGQFIPAVAISHQWALGSWYGNGGGETLFHRVRLGWRLVTSGGGAMDFAGLRSYGVPYRDACAFHVYREPVSCGKRKPGAN